MESISYFVHVHGEPTEDEDQEVSGVYELTLPADYPENQRASAVLDTFHCKVGIDCLDDFTIIVTDVDGNIIEEPEENEAYALQGEAEFLGQVEDAPAPMMPDRTY